MGNSWLVVGILLAIVVCAIASIVSVRVIQKQQNNERDISHINSQVLKHPAKANPIFIIYWIFPFAIIIGAVVLALIYMY